MKSTSLSEVKEFVEAYIENVDVGLPTGKLLNKYQQKNILNLQKAKKEVLMKVLSRINYVENRD